MIIDNGKYNMTQKNSLKDFIKLNPKYCIISKQNI